MNKLLVVARYKEDISWVDKTGLHCLIYNKGPKLARPCNTVPNVGRDSETYLRYILEHYSTIPDLVVFAQGNPFPHCPDFYEQVAKAKGYTELGMNVDSTFHNDFAIRLPYAIAILKRFKIPVPQPLTFVVGMQFAVPKEMIVNKPFKMWRDLYIDFNSDPHKRGPWFYEMIWPAIFHAPYDYRDR